MRGGRVLETLALLNIIQKHGGSVPGAEGGAPSSSVQSPNVWQDRASVVTQDREPSGDTCLSRILQDRQHRILTQLIPVIMTTKHVPTFQDAPVL